MVQVICHDDVKGKRMEIARNEAVHEAVRVMGFKA